MKLKPETIQQHRARQLRDSQVMRDSQAKYLRQVHNLCSCSVCESGLVKDHKHKVSAYVMAACMLLAAVLLVVAFTGKANADTIHIGPIAGYTANQWADAIYKAEGGAKTKHPYGILAHYRHTTPRAACVNTVLHQWRVYQATGKRKRFLEHLAGVYCPIDSNTDDGTCKYWKSNVAYWLERVRDDNK